MGKRVSPQHKASTSTGKGTQQKRGRRRLSVASRRKDTPKKAQPQKSAHDRAPVVPLPPDLEKEIKELRDYIEIQEKVNRGLRSFIAEMTIVFRFIESVSIFHSLDRILQFLMDVIKDLCGYDAGALYLYNAQDHTFAPEPKVVFRPEEIARYQQKLELDERIYNWVFRQGYAVIVPESFIRKGLKKGEQWSYMIAPLMTTSERLGRIELVFKRSQGTFTQQTFSILNVLLKHAAVILVNERVYAKEKETAKKYIELDMLKQDVVSTTTHEIKTPLTIIQAASILLERNRKMTKADRGQLLNKIIHQCERINQIVTELFETSQIDKAKPLLTPETLSLKQLTKEVLDDIHYDDRCIQFRTQFASQLATIWADRSRLYKVVRNLIENAVKYSPQGGLIEIKAYNQDDYVIWQITDHGIGISEEDQKKIFEKFYRAGASTTRSVRGMGFGLYLAKKNVELNQGHISVQSKLKEGSTFTLKFPKGKTLAA